MSRSRGEPMPFKFEALAMYNAERARGIVHTAEWDAKMAALQQEFNDWERAELTRRLGPEIAPGVWGVPRRKPRLRLRRN